jgi:DNA-binding NarL/FixJ family response regulator
VEGQVGIADPLPAYRFGVRAVLEGAGFPTAEPADVASWARGGASRLALLGVVSSDGWSLLDAVAVSAPGAPIVALLDRPSTDDYRRALGAGATAALPRDAAPDQIVEVVRAASGHHTLLPAAVAASLARPADVAVLVLDAEQSRWLRELASGLTVEELAWKEGYSTRTMYRRLQLTYRRLGADDRTRALIRAYELGLIADRRDSSVSTAAPA